MTPNKPPLAMTIREMFQRLAVVKRQRRENANSSRRKSLLEGAERMNQESLSVYGIPESVALVAGVQKCLAIEVW